MASDDEFNDLDIPELSAEEWALVDAQASVALLLFERRSEGPASPPTTPSRNLSSRSHTPNYTSPRARQAKYPPAPSPSPSPMRAARTAANAYRHQSRDLLSKFRPNGHLSVSDLVGPAWCEVKFDYNLRWAPRWLRAAQKPQTMVTAKGKEIEVRKTQAQRGEAIMDAGAV